MLALLAVAGPLAAQPAPLFLPSAAASREFLEPSGDVPGPGARRARLAGMAVDQLERVRQTGGGAVMLNLFNDAAFPAEFSGITETERGYSLAGRVVNDPGSAVVIVVNGDVLVGSVLSSRGTYSIESVGPGLFRVRQLDETTFLPPDPPGGPPDPPEFVPAPAPDLPSTRRDSGAVIDVLVVYTPAAEALANRVASGSILAFIDLFVGLTNVAYEQSGVAQRVNWVGYGRVDYREAPHVPGSPGMETDLDRLTFPRDGWLDEVHTWRNQAAADLVHMVVHSPSPFGGIAWVPLSSAAFHPASPTPFGVTQIFNATHGDALTFAHELGHNMGLQHDRYTNLKEGRPLSGALRPYAFGYVNQRALSLDSSIRSLWRTVMAYTAQCTDAFWWVSCRSVAGFSNPALTD